MDTIKIGIVGCRNFTNYDAFCEHIKSHITGDNIEIVSGGSSGVDSLAKKYAKANEYKYTEFPADWDRYGKRAGPMRNTEIVTYSDEIIAFPSFKSIGTWDTITKANKAGKKLTLIRI